MLHFFCTRFRSVSPYNIKRRQGTTRVSCLLMYSYICLLFFVVFLYPQHLACIVDGGLGEGASTHHLCEFADALVGSECADVADGSIFCVLLIYLVVRGALSCNLRQVGDTDDLATVAGDALHDVGHAGRYGARYACVNLVEDEGRHGCGRGDDALE